MSESRRSDCPVACTLDLVGDKWTMLVIRDLVLGKTRFRDFTASPEGIPTNILTERLQRLQDHGIVEKVVGTEPGARQARYHLTEKGDGLKVVLRALKDWGQKYVPDTVVPGEQ